MHRSDWLPEAEFHLLTDGAVTIITMCTGVVSHRVRLDVLIPMKRSTFLDRVYPEWRSVNPMMRPMHVVEWQEPCGFKSGHPGKCGRELPDIFDEQGNVRPAIARAMERMNRRKSDAATEDHGGDAHP